MNDLFEKCTALFPKVFSLVAVMYMVLWVTIMVGWGLNISNIITAIDLPMTKMFALQVIGIFLFPLGSLLGWVL